MPPTYRLLLCLALLLMAGPSPALEPGRETTERRGAAHDTQQETKGAEDPAPLLEQILGQMDTAYQAIQTYRAEFDQESETKAFPRKMHAAGKVYFSKPNKMRWSYLSPEIREVYLVGEKIHIYLPARNQVIEQTWNDSMPGMAPARLFMGVTELLGSFVVSLDSADNGDDEAYLLRLMPKKREAISVEEVLLRVGKKDLLPIRTESRDVLGNRTVLHFRNAQVNVPLKDDLFLFDAPPEAEVLNIPF